MYRKCVTCSRTKGRVAGRAGGLIRFDDRVQYNISGGREAGVSHPSAKFVAHRDDNDIMHTSA